MEATTANTSTREPVEAMTKSTTTVPKLSHEPVEAPAASSFTVPKPQQKKGKKRARIPALLAPFVERSYARQRTVAKIASHQIRSLAKANSSLQHRNSFPTGLAEPTATYRTESELLSSPIAKLIDLTASTPASISSSASVVSTTASEARPLAH